ncbi:glutamate--ammonia ligase, partial [Friedmanniomyces endolithicus]
DRRPASNADPYQITGMIVETLCGKVEGTDVLKKSTAVSAVEQDMPVVVSKP